MFNIMHLQQIFIDVTCKKYIIIFVLFEKYRYDRDKIFISQCVTNIT